MPMEAWMNLDAVETRYLVELAKTFAHILLVLVLAAIALALSRRLIDGNVHYVPNGSVTTVTNMTRTFAYSVIDVRVAYREDLDQVYDLIRRTAAAMREDPEWRVRILEDLELAGVERWADSGVVVRCRFKVLPIEQWNVRREFYKRLKRVFDDNGIEIPYPHVTLYPGRDKRGEAPPLHILPVGEGGEALFPKTSVAEMGDHGTRRRSHS